MPITDIAEILEMPLEWVKEVKDSQISQEVVAV